MHIGMTMLLYGTQAVILLPESALNCNCIKTPTPTRSHYHINDSANMYSVCHS